MSLSVPTPCCDVAGLDIVERLARGILEVLELLVEARLVEQFLVGGIERRGRHVLFRGAFLVAEGFIYMRQRLVRVEQAGVVLD